MPAAAPVEEDAKLHHTWDSSTGLDSLIKSMSGSDLGSSQQLSVPVTPHSPTPSQELGNRTPAVGTRLSPNKNAISKLEEDDINSPPPPPTTTTTATTAAAPTPTPPQGPIGTLSVSNAASASSTAPASNKVPIKSLNKKPSVAVKKLGAKKLEVSSQADTKLESFEAVDRRLDKMNNASTASAAANLMNNSMAAAPSAPAPSSRLQSIYQDSLGGSNSNVPAEPESRYRSTPSTAAPSASSSTTSRYGSLGAGGASTSNPAASPTGAESRAARDRYSSAKSISSDQYFGRDESAAQEARGRLGNYSNASAISSDMLNHDAHHDDGRYDSGNRSDSGDILGKVKDSVKGLLNDWQNKYGDML